MYISNMFHFPDKKGNIPVEMKWSGFAPDAVMRGESVTARLQGGIIQQQ